MTNTTPNEEQIDYGTDCGSVQEVTIGVTVLLEADSPAAAEEIILSMELETIVDQMNDGDFLGVHKLIQVRTIPVAALFQRQIELGSDGSFFPTPEDADTPLDAGIAIQNLKIGQGMSSAGLGFAALEFLRESELQHAFLGFLEDQVRKNGSVLDAPGHEGP